MTIAIIIISIFIVSFTVKLIIDFNRPLLNRPLYLSRPFSLTTMIWLFIMSPFNLWKEAMFRLKRRAQQKDSEELDQKSNEDASFISQKAKEFSDQLLLDMIKEQGKRLKKKPK